MSNATTNGTSPTFGGHIGTIDLVVILIYMVLCLAVGFWATWRTQRSSLLGYFLAGREMPWFAIGASIFSSDFGMGATLGMAGTAAASGIGVANYELSVGSSIFASNFGIGITFGEAGSAATAGIAVANYELIGIFCVLLLAWLFVPVYIASGAYTLPEYLKKRFGGQRLQIYMSVLSLLLCVFVKLSSDIYAGAIFIKTFIGWNMYLGVAVLLAITAIYTIAGGLKAVIYTDTLQTVVLLIGCIILTVFSFNRVGGINALYDKYMAAIPAVTINGSTCGYPHGDSFHLLRDIETGDPPWTGNIFGITILGSWYFCSDQVMVQRSLAAKNMHHVKGGSILAGYLKLLPLFIIVFPGMVSRVLFPDEVACIDGDICQEVCDNRAGCSNIAYPKLIAELMPPGLRGVMVAAMLAFLMSTLTSGFNSSSTILTIDIWRKWRPRASDGELLVIGRVFVLVMVVVTILWLPVLQSAQGGQLFNYIQSVTGYLTPPVLAVYLLAITWNRTNEPGAFWGLVIGLTVGVIRMVLDFYYGEPGCGEMDNRPAVISKVHFLHFTIILFIISVISTVIVSLLTPPIDDKHLTKLTWWTRHSDKARVPLENGVDPGNEDAQYQACEQLEAENVTPDTPPLWKRAVFIVCGYQPPNKDQGAVSEEERAKQLAKFTSIKENPRWRRFVNVNAILLMLVAVFLWGFYA